jgi:Predicted ATPase of the PP-loop superfamily implicated in cell cycle control
MEFFEQVERNIITKFRPVLWAPFVSAVKEYKLIAEGDKIAVCVSGGKDSMLLAKLVQELQRHGGKKFEALYLAMDPGYNEINRQKLESNARLLGVPLTIFETDIFSVANNSEESPCYLCARMRRGHLYAKAKELGCNKIALGHHMSDAIETTLMGILWGAQMQGMLPRIRSANFEGMELVRPLYKVNEENIIKWRDFHNLEFIACACRFTENCASCGAVGTTRYKVKALIRSLKKENPDVEKNIFTAIHNVKLDTLAGYKFKGEEHSFLEKFE